MTVTSHRRGRQKTQTPTNSRSHQRSNTSASVSNLVTPHRISHLSTANLSLDCNRTCILCESLKSMDKLFPFLARRSSAASAGRMPVQPVPLATRDLALLLGGAVAGPPSQNRSLPAERLDHERIPRVPFDEGL